MQKTWFRFLLPFACVLFFLTWSTLQVEAKGNRSVRSHCQAKGRGSKARCSRKSRRRSRSSARRSKTRAKARRRSRSKRRAIARQRQSSTAIAAAGTETGPLRVKSRSALVVDEQGNPIFAKGIDNVRSIASVTKLMTAMVVLDANLPMDEEITITMEDKDTIKNSSSRLRIGRAVLTRGEMLKIALMSSENRAASALGRTTFPGGIAEFVDAMNRKAQSLGMTNSHFADSTGLRPENVSTAADLIKMVRAAREYPLIREATTTPEAQLNPHPGGRPLRYVNTNRLVRTASENWEVQLSKTGYISEAGRCLVMEVRIPTGTYDFVFLNSSGKLTPIGDFNRVRRWLQRKGSQEFGQK